MPDIPDRRKTGVHEITFEDDNGKKQRTYQVSVQRARAWVGLLSAVLGLAVMIGGMVWASVKFGVATQVHSVIEEECDPDGMIYEEIEQTSRDFIEEVQGVIQDDLDVFEMRLDSVEGLGIELKAGQAAMSDQTDRNQAELKMLIQRAIDEGGSG